jgi:hypothetical protein
MKMPFDQLEPTDAALDRQIESLVGKQVRGELTDEEHLLLVRLVARQSRNMRPGRAASNRYFLRRASAA